MKGTPTQLKLVAPTQPPSLPVITTQMETVCHFLQILNLPLDQNNPKKPLKIFLFHP